MTAVQVLPQTPRAATDLPPRQGKGPKGSILAGVLGWGGALIFFFPVFWMFTTGFKQESQASTDPPTFFFVPTLDQYTRDFRTQLRAVLPQLGDGIDLLNHARYRPGDPGRLRTVHRTSGGLARLAVLLHLDAHDAGGCIDPAALCHRQNIGLLDNIWLLVLIYTAMNLPIAVWMIRSFLIELPKEVLEAARVDGAKLSTEMRRIILPMIAPGLAATALICFIFAWNEFFFAVSLTATQAATVPVFLVGFITSEGLFWARLSAASTMAVLPVIIAGWVAQKWLVRGLSLGAVK